MKASKFLFHPHITLAAVIAALVSLAGSCTALATALDPISKLSFLGGFLPTFLHYKSAIAQFGIACTVLAGVLTVIAGAGRSFVSAVDNPGKYKGA